MKTESIEGVEMFNFADNQFEHANSFESVALTSLYQLPAPVTNIRNPEFHCKECNMFLNSAFVYQQHLTGQKHLKNVNNLNPIQVYFIRMFEEYFSTMFKRLLFYHRISRH